MDGFKSQLLTARCPIIRKIPWFEFTEKVNVVVAFTISIMIQHIEAVSVCKDCVRNFRALAETFFMSQATISQLLPLSLLFFADTLGLHHS